MGSVQWIPNAPVEWLGAVVPEIWFSSGCGGPRARWLPDGRIEIEGQGIPTKPLPPDVAQWNELTAQASAKYSIPAQFIAGVIATESAGKQKALSYANASGLMQLLPSTASGLAKRTVTADELMNDPELNIDLGTKYMRQLWDKYKGNPIKIAAGYNAGSVICGAPKKCPDNPNQWNTVADCDGPSGIGGKAVDYPMRIFGYTNAALGAGVGTSSGAGAGGIATWKVIVGGLALGVLGFVLWKGGVKGAVGALKSNPLNEALINRAANMLRYGYHTEEITAILERDRPAHTRAEIHFAIRLAEPRAKRLWEQARRQYELSGGDR